MNSLVIGMSEVVAEVFTIAEKTGIEPQCVYEFIKGKRAGSDFNVKLLMGRC
jgi:3-hydroxyisobutyrate dehydrogenase-like beta-hydroxyacid dehydrogenase